MRNSDTQNVCSFVLVTTQNPVMTQYFENYSVTQQCWALKLYINTLWYKYNKPMQKNLQICKPYRRSSRKPLGDESQSIEGRAAIELLALKKEKNDSIMIQHAKQTDVFFLFVNTGLLWNVYLGFVFKIRETSYDVTVNKGQVSTISQCCRMLNLRHLKRGNIIGKSDNFEQS